MSQNQVHPNSDWWFTIIVLVEMQFWSIAGSSGSRWIVTFLMPVLMGMHVQSESLKFGFCKVSKIVHFSCLFWQTVFVVPPVGLLVRCLPGQKSRNSAVEIQSLAHLMSFILISWTQSQFDLLNGCLGDRRLPRSGIFSQLGNWSSLPEDDISITKSVDEHFQVFHSPFQVCRLHSLVTSGLFCFPSVGQPRINAFLGLEPLSCASRYSWEETPDQTLLKT